MRAIILFMMFVLVAGLVSATDGLSSCTLTGNHYKCTGTINANEFLGGSHSIDIYDAIITYTSPAGIGAGGNAQNATMVVTSDNKVRLRNVVVVNTGGFGATGQDESNENGGNGGDAGLSIVADESYFYNVSFTATSGDGGDGDANAHWESGDSPRSCEGPTNAAGGESGTVHWSIISDVVFMDNVSAVLTGGNGGEPNSDACADEAENGEVNCETESQIGVNGGDIILDVQTTNTTAINVTFDINGGAGSEAHASYSYDPNGGGDGDSCSSSSDDEGGRGGIAIFNWTGTVADFTDIDVDINGGNTADSETSCVAEAIDGDDVGTTDSIDGINGEDNIINFDYTTLTMSNIDLTTTSSNGGGAHSCYDDDGGYSDSDYVSGDGGDGGINKIYLTSVSSNIDDFNLTASGGQGGLQSCDKINYPGSCGGAGGAGGETQIYLDGVLLNNSNITATGGAGAAYGNDGYGGDGGDIYLYLYGSSILNSNAIVSGGVAASGPNSDCSIYGCSGGRGGLIYIFSNDTTYINGSTLTMAGSSAGSGSQSSSPVSGGGGVELDNDGNFNAYQSNLIFSGGTGYNSVEGGDVFFNSDTLFNSYNTLFNFTTGGSDGDCESVVNGTVILMDTNISCVSSGTATIIGSAMDEWSYKNNTNITLTGTGNQINLTYDGTKQKYLTWNSKFSDTYIFWDSAYCEFGNRTPASTGLSVFNESCTAVGYDQYATDIILHEQYWLFEGQKKVKPYTYPTYYCGVTATFPDDTENTITADFAWFEDGVAGNTQSAYALTSGVQYNSTATHSDVDVGDNITCTLTIDSGGSPILSQDNQSDVVRAYHENLKIDVGNTGEFDVILNGTFDNAGYVLTLDYGGLNEYLRDCDTTYCDVPVRFISDEHGNLEFNDLEAQYGVYDTSGDRFNLTLAIFSEDPGNVQLSGLNAPYNISDGYVVSVTAETPSESQQYNITLIISEFNESLPPGVLVFEMYPQTIVQYAVAPEGQTVTMPIFNITNLHATEDIDVMIRLNKSWVSMGLSCTELGFYLEGAGAVPIKNISTDPYLYCQNISSGESCGIWAYQDFDCTWEEVVNFVYEPEFIFDSICSDCVRTVDWNE